MPRKAKFKDIEATEIIEGGHTYEARESIVKELKRLRNRQELFEYLRSWALAHIPRPDGLDVKFQDADGKCYLLYVGIWFKVYDNYGNVITSADDAISELTD